MQKERTVKELYDETIKKIEKIPGFKKIDELGLQQVLIIEALRYYSDLVLANPAPDSKDEGICPREWYFLNKTVNEIIKESFE